MKENNSGIIHELNLKEKAIHDIPVHLRDGGNRLWHPPVENMQLERYVLKLHKFIVTYDFVQEVDPLVLCQRCIYRVEGRDIAWWVLRALQSLSPNLSVPHTLDWWYRPVGQVLGDSLIAIRPHGLPELTLPSCT